MKTFHYEPLQLTAKEKEQLQQQELSADPADRIFTKYYQRTKHLLLDDYWQKGKQKADLEEIMDEFLCCEASLKKLGEDYIRDWELWYEMVSTMNGVFTVKKMRLTFEV